MKQAWIKWMACGAVALGSVNLAHAQVEGQRREIVVGVPSNTPQQKLLAKRAAQLDCYRKLAERIFGLQITADTHVRDFVTESDRVRTNVDALIKGARFSEPRYPGDGSCEMDAEVTIEQIVTVLKRSADEIRDGGRFNSRTIEEISRRAEQQVIRVTGAGAANVASEIPDPTTEPIISRLLPAPSGAPAMAPLPAIYSHYPPNERLKAKRAAEVDAYRLLLERIYGLRLASGTTCGEFLTKYDEIRTRTEGQLRGAQETEVRYRSDGVVEVQMQVTIEQIVTIIKRSADEVFHNGNWERREFEDISKRNERNVISVVGTGALDTAGAPPVRTEEREIRRENGEIRIIP